MKILRIDDNEDHKFVPRMSENGTKELHDCVQFEHGAVAVCDICGKDYHEYEEDHVKCPLGK